MISRVSGTLRTIRSAFRTTRRYAGRLTSRWPTALERLRHEEFALDGPASLLSCIIAIRRQELGSDEKSSRPKSFPGPISITWLGANSAIEGLTLQPSAF